MTFKNIWQSVSSSVLFTLLIKIPTLPKLGFIVGSYMAFFSLAPMIVPLSGAFGGLLGSFLTFSFLLIFRLITHGFFSLHYLAYHIPGLFASLYWAVESKWLRSIPALVSMILFVVHPVGSHAALYSLLWLIPLYLTIRTKQSTASQAVASTFTAHAVGSVIWLYTVPMSADAWLMLIPVAFAERMVFAGAMTAYYRIFENCLSYAVYLRKPATQS